MNITITKTISNKVDVQIPIPSFWKEPVSFFQSYRAILDEKTFVQVLVMNDGQNIRIHNSIPELSIDQIAEAHNNWDICTEAEFFNAYDDAHEASRIKPVLIDTGSEEAYMEFMKTQNF